MSAVEALELLVTCRRCQAEPGRWCITKQGNKATTLHGARYWDTRPVRTLFWFDEEYAVKALAERALSPTADTEMVLRQALRSANSMIELMRARLEEVS